MTKELIFDLFRFSGRRDRKSHLIASLTLLILFHIPLYVFYESGSVSILSLALIMGIPLFCAFHIFWWWLSAGGSYLRHFDEVIAVTQNIVIFSKDMSLIALMSLFCIACFCTQAQRCRDTNRTGWAVLIPVIPVVGWIFAWALYFIPGTAGDNRYGSNSIPQK